MLWRNEARKQFIFKTKEITNLIRIDKLTKSSANNIMGSISNENQKYIHGVKNKVEVLYSTPKREARTVYIINP